MRGKTKKELKRWVDGYYPLYIQFWVPKRPGEKPLTQRQLFKRAKKEWNRRKN